MVAEIADEHRPILTAQPEHDRARVLGRRVVQLVILLVPIVFLAYMGWQRRWTADDGFINLRIVRQILAGNGPVFNIGDRVEAGTSPAWLGLLAVLDVLTPVRLEWIAVFAGLGATVGGLAFAIFGTRDALAAGRPGRCTFLPLGALVYAVVPPAWDFATSGLETGLSLLWLGVMWWLLCRRVAAVERRGGPPPVVVAIVAGIGPLVRPDFLLFTVFFVVALLVTCERRPRVVIGVVASALVLPVAAELFRMAYFASIVPNTAVAKEATRSYWNQGWRYLENFSGIYYLYVPVTVLLILLALGLRRGESPTGVAFRRVAWLVVAAAVLQAAYVTRVGGDFMSGRMLLPALFVVLLPVAVVRVTEWVQWVAAGIVVVWAFGCAISFRPDAIVDFDFVAENNRVIDERAYWVGAAGSTNPVTIDDYSASVLVGDGRYAAELARRGERVLILTALPEADRLMPIRPGSTVPVVADVGPMGLYAYSAGTDVSVVDTFGLSDSTASHQFVPVRGRPGHEKYRGAPWVIAEYADPAAPIPPMIPADQVLAARRALDCAELANLRGSQQATLSVRQILHNVIGSYGLTKFRYAPDPITAERELCGQSG